MHYLYNEFYKKGRNYTPADFQKACELMAGSSLEQFFSRYVRAREELDYDAGLNAAGLRLDTNGVPESVSRTARLRSFGVDLVPEGERLMVRRVYAGSPAYEQGLNAGDQVVAFDGSRASGDFFLARLAEKRPGDVVHLTIFRFDELRSLDIKLGASRLAIYRIVPLAQPNEQQKKIYQAWLRATLGQ
jgi:predicted metalloprotease with PDZ domain